jgi:Ca-activated chloride channel family protein
MSELTFGAPRMLALLILPAALAVVWAWRLVRRRRDLQRLRAHRVVPLREHFAIGGELWFWLFQVAAAALLILAMARPQAPSSVPRRAGLDVVLLQDASASMRVTDIAGGAPDPIAAASQDEPARDRWQRSMQFLRELGDTLSWHQDRLALTVFAHIATPQIRLTRDPNTLFFFLDHLRERPPFRLEDDTTWDTNLERAVAWGLRIVEKDEEIHGRSPNATIFVLLTDGETWSGEVAKAVSQVVSRGIPIHVVGVGSLRGGPLPAVAEDGGAPRSPGISRLERTGLQRIAAAGGGGYFELDRDGDRQIAATIVASGRRLSPMLGVESRADELYWWVLGAAAAVAALGLVCLRQAAALGVLLGGGVLTAFAIGPLLF